MATTPKPTPTTTTTTTTTSRRSVEEWLITFAVCCFLVGGLANVLETRRAMPPVPLFGVPPPEGGPHSPPPPPPPPPPTPLPTQTPSLPSVHHTQPSQWTTASASSLHKENVTFQDLVVTIVTSSAAFGHRLPLLYEAWIKDAPFPVVVVTDQAPDRAAVQHVMPGLDVRASACSPQMNGLVCKTKRAFQLMHADFGSGGGGKKWFLRLMDDTLVVLDNILDVLNQVDAGEPLCAGDLIPLVNTSFAYFQGGGGWGLTHAALDLVSQHWGLWDEIVVSGGHSPVSPGFMSMASFSDDLLWGIFVSNFQATGALRLVSLPGWTGAPLDLQGGLVPCHAELRKEFCTQQTFAVGTWTSNNTVVLSAGACRTKMPRVGIAHMGLEIQGGRLPWVEQIVNVSKAFATYAGKLVATFEDSPFYYWRLCALGEDVDPHKKKQEAEMLHRTIYENAVVTKALLSEDFLVVDGKKVSIGLCQEPAEVVNQLLGGTSHATTIHPVLLLPALERLRDHLRFHLRPSAFDLHVNTGTGASSDHGSNRVQLVYRVGENATALAEHVCHRLGMAGNPQCMGYAVTNMQRDLPAYLHYDVLCRRSGMYKVAASQLHAIGSAGNARKDEL